MGNCCAKDGATSTAASAEDGTEMKVVKTEEEEEKESVESTESVSHEESVSDEESRDAFWEFFLNAAREGKIPKSVLLNAVKEGKISETQFFEVTPLADEQPEWKMTKAEFEELVSTVKAIHRDVKNYGERFEEYGHRQR